MGDQVDQSLGGATAGSESVEQRAGAAGELDPIQRLTSEFTHYKAKINGEQKKFRERQEQILERLEKLMQPPQSSSSTGGDSIAGNGQDGWGRYFLDQQIQAAGLSGDDAAMVRGLADGKSPDQAMALIKMLAKQSTQTESAQGAQPPTSGGPGRAGAPAKQPPGPTVRNQRDFMKLTAEQRKAWLDTATEEQVDAVMRSN